MRRCVVISEMDFKRSDVVMFLTATAGLKHAVRGPHAIEPSRCGPKPQ